MSDSDVREIHLSGKQLVFLFMVSVVLAVAVFLLGVSVGRGVRANLGEADAVSAETGRTAAGSPPVVMPPPTRPEARDLTYHNELQGQTPPASPPSPAGAAPPTTPAPSGTPVDEPQLSTGGANASGAAGRSTNPPATSAAPGSPKASGWVITAGAFRSRTNADNRAAKLRSEGLPVSPIVPDPTTGLFHVRVGPYAERADADRAVVRVRRQEPRAKVVR